MSDLYKVDCELNYAVAEPSTFVFKIEAMHTPEQRVLTEALTTLPSLPIDRYTDSLGNRVARLNVPAGPFSIRYCADVHMQRRPKPWSLGETPVGQLPLDVMPFLQGSRYVESEVLFNEALSWIGAHDRGYARVQRICDWVRANIRYQIGTSLPYGTARDVLNTRTGVCRDYAHVCIALCRALGIPARFVVGHVQWDTPPPDFHALFEAYLDGHWVLFDPTAMAETGDVIRIGHGLDAADLPFATIFGRAQMTAMNPLVFKNPQEQARAA